jgi:hypothetical protein
VQPTADGQTAARAAVLSELDLDGSWAGGPVLSNASNRMRCPNYHPNYSDLVRTGEASAVFAQPGIQMRSDSLVLRTAEMVKLDWQRSFGSRTYLSCSRANMQKAATATTRFISMRRLAIPPIGDRTAAFRALFDVKTTSGEVIRAAIDIVAVAKGNTEIALLTTMPHSRVPTLWPNEIVLAKLLAARIP